MLSCGILQEIWVVPVPIKFNELRKSFINFRKTAVDADTSTDGHCSGGLIFERQPSEDLKQGIKRRTGVSTDRSKAPLASLNYLKMFLNCINMLGSNRPDALPEWLAQIFHFPILESSNQANRGLAFPTGSDLRTRKWYKGKAVIYIYMYNYIHTM